VLKIISGILTSIGVLAIFAITFIGINTMAWNDWVEFSSKIVLLLADFF
jgi:hypothetical protein